MKIKLLFLLFSALLTLHAQTVNLEWTAAKAYSVDYENKINLPFFNNEGYSVHQNVPHFNYVENATGMGKVSLENIQYAILTTSERGQLNLDDIPSKLDYDARVQKGGNEYFLTVSMIPLVREGNQIKKVTSFQIIHQQGVPSDHRPEETYDPATQSALRNGNWYKIKIKKSGIFKLDRTFFAQNGIPTNFDPRTLKIYGNGGKMLNENPGDFRYGALQENAIQFNGEEDGSFDGSDFILFYGQGPHDWNRKSNSTLSNLSHRFNIYSDEAYYFITFGGQNGKRVQNVEIPGTPTQTFNQYHEYVFHEKDSINLNQIGRQWGGEPFNLEPSRTFTLTGNAPAASGIQGYAKYRLLSQQGQGATYSGSVNGNLISTGTVPSNGTYQNNFRELEGNLAFNPSGNAFNFTIEINNATNPAAYILLDYLEVRYTANLTFNGTQMNFRRLENLNDGNVYGFSISGAQKIWNVSDITTASNVIGSGNIFKFQSNSPYFLNEFVAFNESAAYTEVEFAGSVVNQDIRSLTGIDYAIVVHPDYLSEASRLANFRQQNDGVKVAVVTTDQVYNDFSSGAQDISAIRDFFKHLRDTGSPLKYTLLFGGASYDFKNRILDNTHFVPAYQSFASAALEDSYVTDDFFTMLDDTDMVMSTSTNFFNYGTSYSPQMDVAIGRLPAHSPSEAKTMVDKIISYYNKQPSQGTSFGDWKTKFYLVVDDDDPGTGNAVFHNVIESTAAQFIDNNIEYATLRKLYLDAFPATGTSAGQRYPQVNQGIANAFDLGSALVVYFGHGGPRSWAQERIITYEEINNFSNFSGLYSRLPVVMTITCDFTVWDLPQLASAGEYMFKNPTGGAVAMLTTSRPIGTEYGKNFNEDIIEKILEVNGVAFLPLGEALRAAKVAYGGNSNHYSVNLLGDPMLSISRPPRDIRITKINGENAESFTGILRALDFVEIEGEVLNANGTGKDGSFNGKANATLFDKPVNKTTLNNDGDKDVLNYQEQVNAIFKGGTNVTNGEFKFQFYVPKDINYEIGDGKLTVYAHNNATDAVTTRTVRVGDQNPNGLQDDEGPTIGLYMNNLNFVDGGITDRDPYILACLVDNTGINTSGVAIGHDITGIVDGDVENTYVLNEYYEGGDNNPCTNPQVLDYQKGQVMYKLSRLELGNHQIAFKAWDINNNSSEQTLDFVVMEDGSDHIYIDKLLNWPNPFTNQTYFHFEHNCDSELDVMVQIFTISGKLVKTIRQPVSAEPWREGYRTGRFAIPWDGLDDFGDKIGKGVYIYRVTAKGVDSELCKGSATAIEKLVILK